MCENDFGYKTRGRLTVLKAYERDAAILCKLCSNKHNDKKAVEQWKKLLNESKEDFFKDVTYIIRNKCDKPIGTVETISKDRNCVEIAIWIPDKIKREKHLQEIIDSMIEWCEEYEEYHLIEKIYSVEESTSYVPIMENIVLSAS